MRTQILPAIDVKDWSASGSCARRLKGAWRKVLCFVSWLRAAKDELPRDWEPAPDAPDPGSFPSWIAAPPQ